MNWSCARNGVFESTFGSLAQVQRINACYHDWIPHEAVLFGYMKVKARCFKCGTWWDGQMEAKKFDNAKPALELLPPSYWEVGTLSHNIAEWYFTRTPGALVDAHPAYDPTPVLEFGRAKYGAHNWFKGMRWGRLVGAFHRHCNKLRYGVWCARDLDDIDPESGLPHGAHAACCHLFLTEYAHRGIGEDDRPSRVEPDVVSALSPVLEPAPITEADLRLKDAIGYALYDLTHGGGVESAIAHLKAVSE